MYPPDLIQPDPALDAAQLDLTQSEGYDQPDLGEEPESSPLSASFLQFSDIERRRLLDRINMDWSADWHDHDQRIQKFVRFTNLWRSTVAGPSDHSNYAVPLIEWNIMAKLANIADSLFGDDAEIIADPVGPSDQEVASKVGLYMTWLIFSAMKIKSNLITFLFRMLMYGRAFCYIPYCQKTYKDAEGETHIDYEGPEFIPLWADDFVTPAEQTTNLHEFSHVFRRYRETPDDLLRGEFESRYEPGSITGQLHWARIFSSASHDEGRSPGSASSRSTLNPIKSTNDYIEGVTYAGQSARGTLEVREWYGRWRMLGPEMDGDVDNWSVREKEETDVLVRVLAETDQIISIQRLVDLWPGIMNRRPFDELPLMDTGEYWCKGYPEMLMTSARELTVNNNLRTDAGEVTVGPPLAVKRGEGLQFKQARWTPKMVIELDDPSNDARMLNFTTNLQYTTLQEQAILSYVERQTGISDQTLGRAIDRPNAPRTARGQIALMGKGDIRLNLDNITLREHLSRIVQRIWLIDSAYSPESVFFRVTEEKARGQFGSKSGFAEMTAQERGGRFDFQIKFATNSMSREAEKEKALLLSQVMLATPLIATNPQAQWHVLDRLSKKMGVSDFKTIVPEPPPLDIPMNADEEWVRALEGQEIHVHPLDHDDLHIEKHKIQVSEQLQSAMPDKPATTKMLMHIIEHEVQKQKKLIAAQQVAAQQAAMGLLANEMGVDPMEFMNQSGLAPIGAQPGQAAPAGALGQSAAQLPNPGSTGLPGSGQGMGETNMVSGIMSGAPDTSNY